MKNYPNISCSFGNQVYDKEFIAFHITSGINLENNKDHNDAMARVIAGFFNNTDLRNIPRRTYIRCGITCDFSHLRITENEQDIEVLCALVQLQSIIDKHLHHAVQFCPCIDIVRVEENFVQAHMYILIHAHISPGIRDVIVEESQSEIFITKLPDTLV